ncbi:MAG: alanine racemase [Elusimicrobiota bacterium]
MRLERSEPKWIEIDLRVVRANLRWIFSKLNPGVSLMAVVKDDAYGHGAVEISRQAVASGASALGVLTVREALALREAGIAAPIHVLAPILPSAAKDVVRRRLIATIDGLSQVKSLAAVSPSRGTKVHLDLNFGLGRWGIQPADVWAFVAALSRFPRIRLAGISTHIDYVPGKNAVEAEEKLNAFFAIASELKKTFPDLVCHAANSSVLTDFPHRQMDMARIGNLLYGAGSPSAAAALKSPWSFKARIVSLLDVPRGRPIGYASEYVAPRRMRVATLLCGYADGIAMEPAERFIGLSPGFQYWGLVRGIRAPFVGRCGMAHVLVDVTGTGNVRVGDEIVLPVRRTAASSRIPRIYLR